MLDDAVLSQPPPSTWTIVLTLKDAGDARVLDTADDIISGFLRSSQQKKRVCPDGTIVYQLQSIEPTLDRHIYTAVANAVAGHCIIRKEDSTRGETPCQDLA